MMTLDAPLAAALATSASLATPGSLAFLSGLLVKATVLIAAAAIAHKLLQRRASAATRHLVWSCTVAALLLLPALSLMLPGWQLPFAPTWSSSVSGAPSAAQLSSANNTRSTDQFSSANNTLSTDQSASSDFASADAAPAPTTTVALPHAATSTRVTDSHRPAPTNPTASNPGFVSTLLDPNRPDRASAWSRPLFAIYAIGVLALLFRQLSQWLSLARLARRATDVHDPDWLRTFDACAREMGVARLVRLLRSREQTMPMAFGTRHPAIVVPAVADLWTDDRRRAVLLHELAHVARFDCLTQMSAAVACALYWPHPAVWWIAGRLRIERELACDDRVLAAGAQPRDYAGHLLELAYALGGGRAPALAVSMARPRQLEGRMLAVLDAARNRTAPGLRGRFAGLAITSALLIPIAGAALTGSALTGATVENNGENPGEPGVQDDASTATVARGIARARSEAVDAEQSRERERDREKDQEPPSEASPGTWEIQPWQRDGQKDDSKVHVQLRHARSSHGFSLPVDRLEGLGAALRASSSATSTVKFALRREAGTFTFEGTLRSGVGAGTYTFAPDPAFADALAKRGLARPTPREQFSLARADIGVAYVDELTRQGYPKPDLALLVRAGDHGVGMEYLRGMDAEGYRVGSLETLITLRDHGVSPDYIRGLAAEGYKGLPAAELQRARDHGISPDYVRGMRAAGYGSLPMEALINARDHGISTDYVKQMDELGFNKLPLDDLIRVRDHGVSADYVREMRDLGYRVSLDELRKARDHGVSPDHIRGLQAAGYKGTPLATLIKTRDHGVSPDYARDIKAAGYANLSLEDLAMLRDHGVTADRIKQANARAGTQLPIDMIRALADRGWR